MGFRLSTFALAAAILLSADSSSAFMPHSTIRPVTSTTARSLGVDPSVLQDLHQHLGSFSLADAADAVADAADAVGSAADAVTAAVASPDASDAVQEVAKKDAGWFGFLTGPTEGLLQLIHNGLMMGGLSENSWGVSIIALTILIKVLTFPLTKTQLESTNKMQALQPAIKELQAKYQSNPEVMNQKIAEMYQTNDVNPLAGCLPSLVQIPVFIGLYRAVLNLAQEDKLNEPFLFLPNLEGPVYGADPAHGSDWLFKGWVDGVPSLGWDDTVSFLIMPVFLVISQLISMQLMQPKDPAQQQNNVILKILPVMIGWFSLNVPAALTVYWVVNNIVTTATTLAIRNSMDMTPVSASSSTATVESPATIFAPPPEKPAGFGDVTPITSTSAVVDAEVVDVDDAVAEEGVAAEAGAGMQAEAPSGGSKKKRGKKRKKKKN